MDIRELKKRKKELGYTNVMIADKAGIPLGTVQKVFSGATKNPRVDTIEALEMVLKMPRKTLPASERWPRQGQYTADDYFALPDDVRVELIDGYIYDMSSPGGIHQFILSELNNEFRKCIESHGDHCIVLFAPFDVRLDGDDRTIVQPDLLVKCEKHEENNAGDDVPDLVAEILSPSTRLKDCTVKLRKYMNAGVREYWIVDPESERVLVYFFEDDPLPRQYSFKDSIPIGISGSECNIEFGIIYERMKNVRTWNIRGVL